jgi:hypothetical protein
MNTISLLLLSGSSSVTSVLPLTTDRRIFLAGGQPWRWKGVSAFPLCDRFARGDNIDPFLDAFAGFNLLRVWDYVMWPDTGWPSQPASVWKQFIAYVTARGFYVEMTALTDDDPARIEPAKRLITDLAGTPGLLIEIGNEPRENGKHIDCEALRGVCESSGLPFASGLNEVDEPHFGTYLTDHSPRDSEWQRKGGHNLMEFYTGEGPASKHEPWPTPGIEDEQMRPDQDGYHPEHYKAYFATCALYGAGATFHYDGGKFGRLPTADEARCAAAALEGLNFCALTTPNDLPGPHTLDEAGENSLRTYQCGGFMVRVPPLATKDAPEPGWTPLDADGILWRREE